MRDPTEDERIRKLKALARNPGTPEEGQAAVTAIGRVIVGEDKWKEVEREKARLKTQKQRLRVQKRWERYHDRKPIREPICQRVAAALNQAQAAFYRQQAADLLQRFHGSLTATEVGSLNRITQLSNMPTERDKARIIDIEVEALLRTGQAALPTKEEKEEALRKWQAQIRAEHVVPEVAKDIAKTIAAARFVVNADGMTLGQLRQELGEEKFEELFAACVAVAAATKGESK